MMTSEITIILLLLAMGFTLVLLFKRNRDSNNMITKFKNEISNLSKECENKDLQFGEISEENRKICNEQKQLEKTINEQNERIREKDGKIDGLTDETKLLGDETNRLSLMVKEQDERIKEKDGRIADLIGETKRLGDETNRLNLLTKELDERIKEKDGRIADLVGETKRLGDETNRLSLMVKDLDERIKNNDLLVRKTEEENRELIRNLDEYKKTVSCYVLLNNLKQNMFIDVREINVVNFAFLKKVAIENPVNVKYMKISNKLEALSEDADSKKFCIIFEDAINSTSYSNIHKEFLSYIHSINEVLTNQIENIYNYCVKNITVFNGSVTEIREVKNIFEFNANEFSKQQTEVLTDISNYYRNLKNYFPKLKKIMNRGFFGQLMRAILRETVEIFLTDIPGVWNTLENSDDEEFIANYKKAIEVFDKICNKFTVQIYEYFVDKVYPLFEKYLSLTYIMISCSMDEETLKNKQEMERFCINFKSFLNFDCGEFVSLYKDTQNDIEKFKLRSLQAQITVNPGS